MPDRRAALTRADLPEALTPDTIRDLPISTLRRLSDHRNGILGREEQRAFDDAVHQVMRDTAQRVSRRLGATDWSRVGRTVDGGPADGPASPSDRQLRRLAQRIGQQIEVAETLAPGVDWTFAQIAPPLPERPAPAEAPPSAPPAPVTATSTSTAASADPTDDTTDDTAGTVSQLEQRINDQVELVEVMSEVADMSRRTFALEQQRDLQNTRTVFFGFVVSVAVLVGGWAPLVDADGWNHRLAIIALTVGTCLVAGAVYALIRVRQRRADRAEEQTAATS